MFGVYDIRGIWGRDLDPWRVELLGAAIREKVKNVDVAVGRDVRVSSLPFSFHLMKGLGGEITDIGITTTPMVYYYSWKERTEVFQVTASHNPPEYNGLKLTHPDGTDWTPEEIREIEEVFGKVEPSGSFRSYIDRSVINDYIEFYRSWEIPRVSLGFDPSNGAAYQLIPLFNELFDLNVINGIPDGRFPSHPPDPTKPESQEDIKQLNTEWGYLTDGDGDRLVLVYRGNVLGADELVAFLAEMGVIRGSVAIEVTMPLTLERYLEDRGIKVYRTPTGRVLIKQIVQDQNISFFAEYSGHYGFKEFNYIDDPIYMFFKVLEANNGRFSTEYKSPYKSNIISIHMSDEEAHSILEKLDPDTIITVDGYDARLPLGRVLIRASRTEKGKWRIFWESEDKEDFEKLSKLMEEILHEITKNTG